MAVSDPAVSPLANLALPLVRAQVTMRLLEDAALPAYKGGMLRGGFGYAFQRVACPQQCWGASEACALTTPCPYRWVFETPHPPGLTTLHDLRDVPRPFVIEPPLDGRAQHTAGEALEFGLVLIGRGIDYMPYFLFAFEQLGRMGLGRGHAQARLGRVEALRPWQPTGQVIYQDGRVLSANNERLVTKDQRDQRTKNKEQRATDTEQASVGGHTADGMPVLDASTIAARAAALPADLRLTLRTPLRVKAHGDWLRAIEPMAIVQATCWRLNALATFHGGGPWAVDHRALVAQAQGIVVDLQQVRWVDWERTSTRGGQARTMTLGGIVGSAVLRGVSPDVRAVLLAGSLVHIGKACVFGYGGYGVEAV